MIKAGSDVVWRCEVCQKIGKVDLEKIALLMGSDTTLANRRPSCRLCPGRVKFEVRRGPFAHSLDTIHEAEDWAYSESERRRLYALGWRVVMGKWKAHQSGD